MRARMGALEDCIAECCWRGLGQAWIGMEIVEGEEFQVDLPG